jgi:hypothetical protein
MEKNPINIPDPQHCSLFRYIIGQKGNGVREMMNKYDVNIRVPAADAKSDIILVSGVPSNVEAAKEGFVQRMQELEAEKEERLKRSFEVPIHFVSQPAQ